MAETVEVVLPRLPFLDNDPRVLATFEVPTESDIEDIVIRETRQQELQAQPQANIPARSGSGTEGNKEEEETGRSVDRDDPAGPTNPNPSPEEDDPSVGNDPPEDDSNGTTPEEEPTEEEELDLPELPELPEAPEPEVPEFPSVDSIANAVATEVAEVIGDPIQSQLDTVTEELVAIDVPTADDISDAVDEVLDDLEERIGQTQDALRQEFEDIDQEVEDLTTDLSTQIETEIDGVESTITSRLRTLNEEVAQDVGDITGAIDTLRERTDRQFETLGRNIGDAFDAQLSSVQTAIDENVDAAVSTLDSSINTIQTELQTSIDSVETQLTGLINDLTEDVNSLLTDVTQVSEDLSGLIEDIPDIVEDGATRALEEIEPELNESGLFTDPVGFAIGFIQAASDELVDPEVSQDLQDTLDNR